MPKQKNKAQQKSIPLIPLPSASAFVTESVELLSKKDAHPDGIISCKGKQFNVHKDLLAVRSKVFNAAFYGQFKEASDGRLSADQFDVEVVGQMIGYFYNGRYDSPEVKKLDLKARGVEEILEQVYNYNSLASQDIRKDWQHRNQVKQGREFAEAVQFHVKMNNIADYYQIKPLATYSSVHIQNLINQHWDVDSFCEVLRLCWDLAVDVKIPELFAQAAAPHIVELLDSEKFQQLEFANSIAEWLTASDKEEVPAKGGCTSTSLG